MDEKGDVDPGSSNKTGFLFFVAATAAVVLAQTGCNCGTEAGHQQHQQHREDRGKVKRYENKTSVKNKEHDNASWPTHGQTADGKRTCIRGRDIRLPDLSRSSYWLFRTRHTIEITLCTCSFEAELCWDVFHSFIHSIVVSTIGYIQEVIENR